MRTKIKHSVLIIFGWFFVILGAIGAILPLLPTTIFLIVALACFAESSPRFHRMLLTNKWVGPSLIQWQESKTINQKAKYKAMLLIIVTFAISIFLLSGKIALQIILFCFCLLLLFYMFQLKESKE